LLQVRSVDDQDPVEDLAVAVRARDLCCALQVGYQQARRNDAPQT